MKKCIKCGAELSEGAKFCSECGTEVLPISSEDTLKEEVVKENKKELKKETPKKTRKTTAKRPRTQPATQPQQEKVEAGVADGDKPAPGYYKWLIIGVAGFGLSVFFGNGGFSLSFWWWIVAVLTCALGWMAYEGAFDTKNVAKWGLMICCIFSFLLTCTDGAESYDSDGYEYVVKGLLSPNTAKMNSYIPKRMFRETAKEKGGITYSRNLDFEYYAIEAMNAFGGMIQNDYVVVFWDGEPIMFDNVRPEDWFSDGMGLQNLQVLLHINCGLTDEQTKLKKN